MTEHRAFDRVPCPHCRGTGSIERVPDPSAATKAEVMEMLRRGSKIEAIKHYRNGSGCSLREAKDAIEAMENAR